MYFVHYPTNSYDQTLDILSLTKTNSPKTSSLPLADFWHPERNEEQKKQIFKKIKVYDLYQKDLDYCFEYPTAAYQNRESGKTLLHSKSSMTDLMIIFGKEARITLEAKYTEYEKKEQYTPVLKDWCNVKHRKDIVQCWLDYINKRCRREISADDLLNDERKKELPYQFLHRTASACFRCEKPILVYQLFYDNNENSVNKMRIFETLLHNCTDILQLNQEALPFFIIETEVTGYPQNYKGNYSDLFTNMKQEQQYTFGDIKILNGYTLNQI